MANNPLQKFYQLIEEEQYRDALGILESEDIPEPIAEKWHQWLTQLHEQDRLQAGVASEKELVRRTQIYYEHAKLIGSAIGLPIFIIAFISLMIMLLSAETLAYLVPTTALITSYYGIRWTVALFFHKNVNEYTAAILFGLLITTVSLMPVRYFYYEDYYLSDTSLLLLGLVWFLPFSAHIGWWLGERIGLRIAKYLRPETDTDDKPKSLEEEA